MKTTEVALDGYVQDISAFGFLIEGNEKHACRESLVLVCRTENKDHAGKPQRRKSKLDVDLPEKDI